MKRWDAALKRLPINDVNMVEIGVWTGRMSEKLLKGHLKLNLIQIDRYLPYTNYERKNEGYTNFSFKKNDSFIKAKEKNKKRIKKYSKRVKLYIMDSLIAVKKIPDNFLDMVFIDGLKQNCKSEIKAYLPKIKKGGWIGGHDYPDRLMVKKAVEEMFQNFEIDCDKTWWYRV